MISGSLFFYQNWLTFLLALWLSFLLTKAQIQDILQFSGVLCDISDKDISVSKGAIVKKLVVYPAMWKVSPDDSTVYVSDSLLKYAKPYAVEEIIKNL